MHPAPYTHFSGGKSSLRIDFKFSPAPNLSSVSNHTDDVREINYHSRGNSFAVKHKIMNVRTVKVNAEILTLLIELDQR